MKRKTAAICVIAFVLFASFLLWELGSPGASPMQQASITGQASNAYGEKVWFNSTVGQQWISSVLPNATASWYVGSAARTKTHYAQSITIGGQQLQNGSGHWKVQFRAGKNTSYYSVRWTSEQTGKAIGTQYSDSYDEQIDTLSAALSFSAANASTTTATFQVFIEVWTTGAISGQQLYANSTTWQSFSSNQISYQRVSQTIQGTYQPQAYYTLIGTYNTGTLANIQSYDGTLISWFAAGGYVDAQYNFNGLPAAGTGIPTLRVRHEGYFLNSASGANGRRIYVATARRTTYSITQTVGVLQWYWDNHTFTFQASDGYNGELRLRQSYSGGGVLQVDFDYVRLTIGGTSYTPTGVTGLSSGVSGALSNINAVDGSVLFVGGGPAYLEWTFTGLPTPSGQTATYSAKIKPEVYALSSWSEATGSTWVDVGVTTTTQLSNTWYTESLDTNYLVNFVEANGTVRIHMKVSVSATQWYLDYIWLQPIQNASWFSDAASVSMITLIAVVAVVAIALWRRRRL